MISAHLFSFLAICKYSDSFECVDNVWSQQKIKLSNVLNISRYRGQLCDKFANIAKPFQVNHLQHHRSPHGIMDNNNNSNSDSDDQQ